MPAAGIETLLMSLESSQVSQKQLNHVFGANLGNFIIFRNRKKLGS